MDVTKFAETSDEEVIDLYLNLSSKIFNMMMMSKDEKETFEALCFEVRRRELNEQIDERRHTQYSKE